MLLIFRCRAAAYSILIASLFVSHSVMAESNSRPKDLFETPESVKSLVKKSGAGEFFKYAGKNTDSYDRLISKISSGDENWVSLFEILWPKADGIYSTSLGSALAPAIKKNPGVVLKQFKKVFPKLLTDDKITINNICSDNPDFWDDNRNSETKISGRKEMEERKKTLENFEDPALNVYRDLCLTATVKELNRIISETEKIKRQM